MLDMSEAFLNAILLLTTECKVLAKGTQVIHFTPTKAGMWTIVSPQRIYIMYAHEGD